MDSQNYIIQSSINFQNQTFTYNVDLSKSVKSFFKEICSYIKTFPNLNSLYYGEKIISRNNLLEVPLCNIIDQSNPIYFKIVPKLLKTPRKHIQTKSINFNSDKKVTILKNLLTDANETNTDTILSSRLSDNKTFSVTVSEIPSVQEIQNILDSFYARKTPNTFSSEPKGFLSRLSKTSVRIDFSEEYILNEFISFISYIKYQNPHFKQIIITKNNSFYNNKRSINSYSTKNIKKTNKLSNSVDIPLHKSSKNVKPNISTNFNINDVIRAKKTSDKNLNLYHGLSLTKENEDEVLHDYFKQQVYLRNSSPYINEGEMKIIEEKENKKKFLNNKNFITSVGKYSMKYNYIPNYVGLTPSENPNNHDFRKVDKEKWLNKKGFI